MKVKRTTRSVIAVIAAAILAIGGSLVFDSTAQGQPSLSASANVQGDANPDVQALAAALSISRHAGKLVALSGPTNTTMTPESLNNAGGGHSRTQGHPRHATWRSWPKPTMKNAPPRSPE